MGELPECVRRPTQRRVAEIRRMHASLPPCEACTGCELIEEVAALEAEVERVKTLTLGAFNQVIAERDHHRETLRQMKHLRNWPAWRDDVWREREPWLFDGGDDE